MTTQESVVQQFRELVEEGRRLLQAYGWTGREFSRSEPGDVYFRFRTSVSNLVRRVCGEDSEHYREMRRLSETEAIARNSHYLVHCLGVLEAAQHDFARGLLFDLRSLIAAELLGDFLEQAEALVAEGYHVPAASLAGAVLEDTMRKLCSKHNIPVPEKTKIDRLNTDLAKANIYNTLTQKRITAFADIRNNADHGHFDKFNRADVEDMVKSVRRLAADYLQ